MYKDELETINIQDEDLRCSICDYYFSNKIKPYNLPCNHNLCIKCIDAIIDKKMFNCPICRRAFSQNDRENFQVNQTLLDSIVKILDLKIIFCKKCQKIFNYNEHYEICDQINFKDSYESLDEISNLANECLQVFKLTDKHMNILVNSKNSLYQEIYEIIKLINIKFYEFFNKTIEKFFEGIPEINYQDSIGEIFDFLKNYEIFLKTSDGEKINIINYQNNSLKININKLPKLPENPNMVNDEILKYKFSNYTNYNEIIHSINMIEDINKSSEYEESSDVENNKNKFDKKYFESTNKKEQKDLFFSANKFENENILEINRLYLKRNTKNEETKQYDFYINPHTQERSKSAMKMPIKNYNDYKTNNQTSRCPSIDDSINNSNFLVIQPEEEKIKNICLEKNKRKIYNPIIYSYNNYWHFTKKSNEIKNINYFNLEKQFKKGHSHMTNDNNNIDNINNRNNLLSYSIDNILLNNFNKNQKNYIDSRKKSVGTEIKPKNSKSREFYINQENEFYEENNFHNCEDSDFVEKNKIKKKFKNQQIKKNLRNNFSSSELTDEVEYINYNNLNNNFINETIASLSNDEQDIKNNRKLIIKLAPEDGDYNNNKTNINNSFFKISKNNNQNISNFEESNKNKSLNKINISFKKSEDKLDLNNTPNSKDFSFKKSEQKNSSNINFSNNERNLSDIKINLHKNNNLTEKKINNLKTENDFNTKIKKIVINGNNLESDKSDIHYVGSVENDSITPPHKMNYNIQKFHQINSDLSKKKGNSISKNFSITPENKIINKNLDNQTNILKNNNNINYSLNPENISHKILLDKKKKLNNLNNYLNSTKEKASENIRQKIIVRNDQVEIINSNNLKKKSDVDKNRNNSNNKMENFNLQNLKEENLNSNNNQKKNILIQENNDPEDFSNNISEGIKTLRNSLLNNYQFENIEEKKMRNSKQKLNQINPLYNNNFCNEIFSNLQTEKIKNNNFQYIINENNNKNLDINYPSSQNNFDNYKFNQKKILEINEFNSINENKDSNKNFYSTKNSNKEEIFSDFNKYNKNLPITHTDSKVYNRNINYTDTGDYNNILEQKKFNKKNFPENNLKKFASLKDDKNSPNANPHNSKSNDEILKKIFNNNFESKNFLKKDLIYLNQNENSGKNNNFLLQNNNISQNISYEEDNYTENYKNRKLNSPSAKNFQNFSTILNKNIERNRISKSPSPNLQFSSHHIYFDKSLSQIQDETELNNEAHNESLEKTIKINTKRNQNFNNYDILEFDYSNLNNLQIEKNLIISTEKNKIKFNSFNNKENSNTNYFETKPNKFEAYFNLLEKYNSIKEKMMRMNNYSQQIELTCETLREQISKNSIQLNEKILTNLNGLCENIIGVKSQNFFSKNFIPNVIENTKKICLFDTKNLKFEVKEFEYLTIKLNVSINIDHDGSDFIFLSGGKINSSMNFFNNETFGDLNGQITDLFLIIRWSNKAIELNSQMLRKRAWHSSMFYNNKLYIVGGAASENLKLKECECYNLIQKQWELLPNLNNSRCNPSLCIYNQEFLYVFNGWVNKDKFLDTIEYINVNNFATGWKVLKPDDPGMAWEGFSNCCSAVIGDNKILIFGGYSKKNENKSYIYDPLKNVVYRGKDMVRGSIFFNNGLFYQNKIYSVDNRNENRKMFGVHVYDLNVNSWKYYQGLQ